MTPGRDSRGYDAGDGIARGNGEALDAYFARDFVFHGPGGGVRLDDLKSLWASRRAAIVVQGDLIAGHTNMSGTFTDVFEQSPVGDLESAGVPMILRLINIFGYVTDGWPA